jgi:hypothetical protein
MDKSTHSPLPTPIFSVSWGSLRLENDVSERCVYYRGNSPAAGRARVVAINPRKTRTAFIVMCSLVVVWKVRMAVLVSWWYIEGMS